MAEAAAEDLPQPGHALGVSRAPETGASLVGLEERLLHDVGSVEFAAQARVELQPSQQHQIGPEPLQHPALAVLIHGGPLARAASPTDR